MTSGHEQRKRRRSEQTAGTVSHDAQRRVDKRVLEIMARRDSAARRDSPSVRMRLRDSITGRS
jgi:hypothetical protein